MTFPYRVSMIVPIYNQEPWLDRTIACLKAQTIPAEDFEVLLIDDGSTDRSPQMCDEYARKYKNFFVVHKENGGLSDARNCGIDHAHGKYLMYLDADDTLAENTVLEVANFFDQHYDEVDLVTYPSKTIRAGEEVAPHYRYRTFKASGVYDLTRWENIYAAVTRIEVAVKNEPGNNVKFSFDRDFRHEDQKYNIDVVLRKMKVGYCDKGCYRYIQQSAGLQSNYFYPYYLFERTMAFWEEEFGKFAPGEVPAYLQALYVSDLHWKKRESILEPYHYDAERLAEADARIDALLDQVDPQVLICHPSIDGYHRAYWLQRMHNVDKQVFTGGNSYALMADGKIAYIRYLVEIILLRTTFEEGKLHLYGFLKSPCFQYGDKPTLTAVATRDGIRTTEEVPTQLSSWIHNGSKDVINTFWLFDYTLVVKNSGSVSFIVDFEGGTCSTSYFFASKAVFSGWDPVRFTVAKHGYVFSFEDNVFLVNKASNKRIKEISKQCDAEFSGRPKTLASRKAAQAIRAAGRRIWLYHDCHGVEKNNAYFQYMHDIEKNDGVERYYVVNDDLKGKEHLFTKEQMRRVIRFRGYRHKLLFLAAEKIITAYVEGVNWNPFDDIGFKYFSDLFDAQITYLQHGVLHAHLPWKYSLDRLLIDREVVSTSFEADNLRENYRFAEKNLIRAGMPRYDLIDQNAPAKRKILIAPSWRKYLVTQKPDGQWEGDPGKFLSSDLYRELRALCDSPELAALLEEYDYVVDVKLHPIFAELYREHLSFSNPRVRLAPDSVEDSEYAVFVTDFSSYRFDYVYLRRAIMYFFPDEELFRSGMCDYRETDLPLGGTFGDMAHTADEAVEILRGILERGGAPKPEYAEQMEGFFLHYDDNQRERIYMALTENES